MFNFSKRETLLSRLRLIKKTREKREEKKAVELPYIFISIAVLKHYTRKKKSLWYINLSTLFLKQENY